MRRRPRASRISTLADVPTDTTCRVESVGVALRELGHDFALGLRPGAIARVLARFPESAPAFAEIEVGIHRVSLPLPLAAQVRVSAC